MKKLVCCVCGSEKILERPRWVNPDKKSKKSRGDHKVWGKIGSCNMCSDKCREWHEQEKPGVCAFHGEIN
jgi:hypothetical protein